jgi:ATP-dependent phosphoenolpyruvate carboxykinase
MKYASMLADKMQAHGTKAWLVNTGWNGGGYGVGSRISLKHTRAIIDAVHSGALDAAEYADVPLFGLRVPTSCSGVPSVLLQPWLQWADKADFTDSLAGLARLFVNNFKVRAPCCRCAGVAGVAGVAGWCWLRWTGSRRRAALCCWCCHTCACLHVRLRHTRTRHLHKTPHQR